MQNGEPKTGPNCRPPPASGRKPLFFQAFQPISPAPAGFRSTRYSSFRGNRLPRFTRIVKAFSPNGGIRPGSLPFDRATCGLLGGPSSLGCRCCPAPSRRRSKLHLKTRADDVKRCGARPEGVWHAVDPVELDASESIPPPVQRQGRLVEHPEVWNRWLFIPSGRI